MGTRGLAAKKLCRRSASTCRFIGVMGDFEAASSACAGAVVVIARGPKVVPATPRPSGGERHLPGASRVCAGQWGFLVLVRILLLKNGPETPVLLGRACRAGWVTDGLPPEARSTSAPEKSRLPKNLCPNSAPDPLFTGRRPRSALDGPPSSGAGATVLLGVVCPKSARICLF